MDVPCAVIYDTVEGVRCIITVGFDGPTGLVNFQLGDEVCTTDKAMRIGVRAGYVGTITKFDDPNKYPAFIWVSFGDQTLRYNFRPEDLSFTEEALQAVVPSTSVDPMLESQAGSQG